MASQSHRSVSVSGPCKPQALETLQEPILLSRWAALLKTHTRPDPVPLDGLGWAVSLARTWMRSVAEEPRGRPSHDTATPAARAATPSSTPTVAADSGWSERPHPHNAQLGGREHCQCLTRLGGQGVGLGFTASRSSPHSTGPCERLGRARGVETVTVADSEALYPDALRWHLKPVRIARPSRIVLKPVCDNVGVLLLGCTLR